MLYVNIRIGFFFKICRLCIYTSTFIGNFDWNKKCCAILPYYMLLTPRQLSIPMRTDIWTKLWNHLPNYILTHSQTSRFKNVVVVEKLAISLVCYQPEVLSRCCTPLSPGGPHFASTGMLADVANIAQFSKSGIDPLPFIEVETSVASKQEHIISVVCKNKISNTTWGKINLSLVRNYIAEFKRSQFAFGQARKEPIMQVHAIAI